MSVDNTAIVDERLDEDDPTVATCLKHGTSIMITYSKRENSVCPLCYNQQKSKMLFDTLLEIKNKVSTKIEILENIV